MLTSKEAQQIGRIEERVNYVAKTLDAHAPRLSILETHMNRVKGVLAFLSAVAALSAVLFFTGCAHYHNTTFHPDGSVMKDIASTVLGSGDTTLLIQCEGGEQSYTTRATGISDNALKAAQAGATIAPPGAAAAVLGEIIHEVAE